MRVSFSTKHGRAIHKAVQKYLPYHDHTPIPQSPNPPSISLFSTLLPHLSLEAFYFPPLSKNIYSPFTVSCLEPISLQIPGSVEWGDTKGLSPRAALHRIRPVFLFPPTSSGEPHESRRNEIFGRYSLIDNYLRPFRPPCTFI